MYQTLYAGLYLYECAVIGHDANLALDVVAGLEVRVEVIPRMRGKLLQTQCDAAFVVVEVKDYHVQTLIKLYNLVRVRYAAPAQVGDVNQAVYATKVDEHTVIGDVLHDAFQHLTLLQLGDDFALLGFQFCLDEGFVADYNVAVIFVDFHHFEFHRFVYEYIVVADGAHVDLRAGQEGLDAEDVYYHAAFGTAFYVALDDFVLLHCLFHAAPAARCTRFLMAENKLTFFVFLVLDEYLYLIAYLKVGIVAEFGDRDDAV
ncbi:putative uncharacterized protein [Prevotella sp. CAG:485]|nr:putative uncharacterized protein [Prevotella sp. CAG:485]